MCGKVVVRLDRAQSEADSNSKNCAREPVELRFKGIVSITLFSLAIKGK